MVADSSVGDVRAVEVAGIRVSGNNQTFIYRFLTIGFSREQRDDGVDRQ